MKYWEIIAANIRRPENDRGPCTTSVLILATVALLPFVTLAQHAPPAQPFQRLDGCVLTSDEWTDGDSFRVRLPDGRLATFRLYFVDTTESRSREVRSDAQAIPRRTVILAREAPIPAESSLRKRDKPVPVLEQ